jgi:hypothetical protein
MRYVNVGVYVCVYVCVRVCVPLRVWTHSSCARVDARTLCLPVCACVCTCLRARALVPADARVRVHTVGSSTTTGGMCLGRRRACPSRRRRWRRSYGGAWCPTPPSRRPLPSTPSRHGQRRCCSCTAGAREKGKASVSRSGRTTWCIEKKSKRGFTKREIDRE